MGDLVSIEIMSYTVILTLDYLDSHPAYKATSFSRPYAEQFKTRPWVGDAYLGILSVDPFVGQLDSDAGWKFEFESEEYYHWFLLQQ